MGRPQIKGYERCPKCNNLGRIRTKNVRSRSTGQYIKRSWFRHNDASIPEHYIDNFIRRMSIQKYDSHPLGEWLKFSDKVSKIHDRTMYDIKMITKKVKVLPLEQDELRRFDSALEWHRANILKPQQVIINLYRMAALRILQNKPLSVDMKEKRGVVRKAFEYGFRDNKKRKALAEKKLREDPDGLVQDAIDIVMSNPLNRELDYLFRKYEQPKRRERDRKRNKK